LNLHPTMLELELIDRIIWLELRKVHFDLI
jgi:hypothetical protein